MAVCHPFLAHIISTPRRAVRLIALIWLVAVACALPQALQLGVVRGQTPDHVLCVVKQKVSSIINLSHYPLSSHTVLLLLFINKLIQSHSSSMGNQQKIFKVRTTHTHHSNHQIFKYKTKYSNNKHFRKMIIKS